MADRCKDCKYWSPLLKNMDIPVTDQWVTGECRCGYPAVIVLDGKVVSVWPTCDETDWCGKFAVGLSGKISPGE